MAGAGGKSIFLNQYPTPRKQQHDANIKNGISITEYSKGGKEQNSPGKAGFHSAHE
jgi:hypothetical protein